jgi:POT family proton-dependent oligopeptide transporter
MWERFSYYGMRALLILYITASTANGGLGFSVAKGAAIYGWYTMLVYATAIPGGWIADRFIGQHRAVLIGGIVIACGHFSMAIPSFASFFLGLGLVVAGTGLLKPNVSSLVGSLYAQNDVRRDAGFSIFYMGINLGAFTAPLLCGYLGQRIGWHWGFGAAGVGMTLGVAQYIAGRKYLGVVAAGPARKASRPRPPRSPLGAVEARRLAAIVVFFVFSVLFWAGFEQQGSSLNLFADRYTRLSVGGWAVPSSWFQSVAPLMVIALSPAFAWLWIRLRRHEPSSPVKFAFGLFLLSLSFLLLALGAQLAQANHILVSPWWLISVFFLQTCGELCLSPVGLSVITKLAPARMVGLMMGVWFLSMSLGNKIGGFVAGYFDRLPLPRVFGTVFAAELAGVALLVVLILPLRRLMGGVH